MCSGVSARGEDDLGFCPAAVAHWAIKIVRVVVHGQGGHRGRNPLHQLYSCLVEYFHHIEQLKCFLVLPVLHQRWSQRSAGNGII